MTGAMKAIEHIWINAHEPLQYISEEPKFFNMFVFKVIYSEIALKQIFAYQYNKLGVGKCENSVIRRLGQRTLQDLLHA